MPLNLYQLTATQAASGIANGQFTSVDLVGDCLARIHSKEEAVKAWAYLHPEQALAQARACDERPASSPLHGVPIGLKDVIDTADMPTCYGSEVYQGHFPDRDAACVQRLKDSGAIMMGKTIATEFAFYAPGKTTNPHNTRHTPGGSSSGSAAAVADFHVPVALGTQTAGSIIRPASYNGIVGFKPTYDAYPLSGVHPLAPRLDTLGLFSRSIEDLTVLHDVLSGKDRGSLEAAQPGVVAFVKTPAWGNAEEYMRSVVSDFVASLASKGIEVIEPDEGPLQGLMETHADYLAQGANESLGCIVDENPDKVKQQTKDLVAAGRMVGPAFREEFRDAFERGGQFLDTVFKQADLIITPAAAGEAPAGLSNTGDPMFNRIWTFLQTPCVSMPLTTGLGGLPIGIQFVCDKNRDINLLSYVAWLKDCIDYQIAPPE